MVVGAWRSDDSQDDLTRILRHGFNFKGKFAFIMPMPHYPNPCLHIDTFKVFGLPLSDREANLIVTAAQLGIFSSQDQREPLDGAGPPTGEDTVEDAILINYSKISFKNPRWAPYVDEVVHKRVCETLGCAPSGTALQLCGLFHQKAGSR